jgi:hypothetical protein
MYLSNDREQVAALEGIPLSLQATHLPSFVVMFLPNSPSGLTHFITIPTHNTSVWVVHVNSFEVARSFLVLYEPQAA